MTAVKTGPLAGCRVVTTRDEPGELDSILTAQGAEVVHVALIEIGDPPDGGAALEVALAGLHDAEWLIVTSQHGARRVAGTARRCPSVRLAAVGTATARELASGAGRPVDLVPERQTAADLLAAMPAPDGTGRIVLAQADRAEPLLADGLSGAGWTVDSVTAYSTRLRAPTETERTSVLAGDVLTFASGSAATAWATAIGPVTPPIVVAIGPTTRAVALEQGLQITHVAADQSVEGLARAVAAAWSGQS